METRSIHGPHLLMGSMKMPMPRHSTHRIASTAVRLSLGNLCSSDSATASNIFCSELTPAKIIAR